MTALIIHFEVRDTAAEFKDNYQLIYNLFNILLFHIKFLINYKDQYTNEHTRYEHIYPASNFLKNIFPPDIMVA